jgi:hypothetical protein
MSTARGVHAGVHDHRLTARRHHEPPHDPADRRGRVPSFAIPYFYLINTDSFILATIAEIIGFGLVFDFG